MAVDAGGAAHPIKKHARVVCGECAISVRLRRQGCRVFAGRGCGGPAGSRGEPPAGRPETVETNGFNFPFARVSGSCLATRTDPAPCRRRAGGLPASENSLGRGLRWRGWCQSPSEKPRVWPERAPAQGCVPRRAGASPVPAACFPGAACEVTE